MKCLMYLQCDARYNSFLLKDIQGKKVIEHVIERMKQLGKYEIISSLFSCSDNLELVEILKKNGVKAELSDNDNVTQRFLYSTTGFENCYVIRVCGDQALLDVRTSKSIIENIEGYDFYYEPGLQGNVLPDIVRSETLKDNYECIKNANRYFDAIITNQNIKRLKINVNMLFHKCRVNDWLSYVVAKKIIENNQDIYELSRKMAESLACNESSIYKNGILSSWFLGSTCEEFFYGENREVNPWWSEAAVYFVKDKIKACNNLRVFEWGCGNSTLFFERFCNQVISIEHDEKWCAKMRQVVSSNVQIKYVPLEYDGDYCRAINTEVEQFDIVLIDGRDRVRCAKSCIDMLKDDGIIIWDNTERDCYAEGYEFLKQCGFKRIEFSGILHGVPGYKDSTSVFYRERNIFNI